MNPTLLLHHQFIPSAPRRSTFTFKNRGKFSWGTARSLLLLSFLILTAALFVSYLILAHGVVGDAFKANAYQKSIETLKEENRLLGIDIARLNSYSYIFEESKKLNMVEVRNPVRMEIGEDIVARLEK